jgi:hypothetical protein
MTPEQISTHLKSYRERLDKIASEERDRVEREAAQYKEKEIRCHRVLSEVSEPLLRRLSKLLTEAGHENTLHPAQETQHTTRRTNLRSTDYATAIALQRPNGALTLRVVAKPDSMQVSSFIGVPHANCSSVFHVTDGPLNEAEEVTNRGIADFVTAAFPLR